MFYHLCRMLIGACNGVVAMGGCYGWLLWVDDALWDADWCLQWCGVRNRGPRQAPAQPMPDYGPPQGKWWRFDAQRCGNFDMIWDHFARVSQRLLCFTALDPHSPRAALRSVPILCGMLIGACDSMGGCYGWLLWVVAMGGCYGWMLFTGC